jgi:hypothetical protein
VITGALFCSAAGNTLRCIANDGISESTNTIMRCFLFRQADRVGLPGDISAAAGCQQQGHERSGLAGVQAVEGTPQDGVLLLREECPPGVLIPPQLSVACRQVFNNLLPSQQAPICP